MSRRTLVRLDVAEMITTEPPPVAWVAKDLVVREGVTLLSGEPGVGKSMLGMTLGVSVASGTTFLSEPTEAGVVMYVDAENGRAEAHRRIRAMGLELEDASKFHYLVSAEHDLIRDRAEIVGHAESIEPTLVVIDSLRSLWSGDENDSGAAAQVMETAAALARVTKAGVLVLHHVPKNSTSAYRGSSAFAGAAEVVATLRRSGGSEGASKTLTLAIEKCRPENPASDRYVEVGFVEGILAVEKAGKPGAPARVNADLKQRLLDALPANPGRMTQGHACRVVGRDTTDKSVRKALAGLQAQGIADRDDAGWYLVAEGVYSSTTPTPGDSTPPNPADLDYSTVLKEVP